MPVGLGRLFLTLSGQDFRMDMRRTDPVLGHFKSTLQIAAVKIVERRVGERW